MELVGIGINYKDNHNRTLPKMHGLDQRYQRTLWLLFAYPSAPPAVSFVHFHIKQSKYMNKKKNLAMEKYNFFSNAVSSAV